MARLLNILANLLPEHPSATAAVIRDWDGDPGLHGDGVPLRLTGGLHALILTGQASDLKEVYPPHEVEDDILRWALDQALTQRDMRLLEALTRAPQTNEVRRASLLIAVAHELGHLFQKGSGPKGKTPFWVSEIGASAGLNLNFDQFYLLIGAGFGPKESLVQLSPDWSGALPPRSEISVAGREGVDLAPVDLSSEDAQLRLLSYLWPDQPERIARTRAAMTLPAPKVVQADALAWLPERLAAAPKSHVHLLYSTIAWQYLPPEARAEGAALIQEAGERATSDTPLAWFRMEADAQPGSAALTLDLWPGRLRYSLGRADFHGRWVAWTGIDKG